MIRKLIREDRQKIESILHDTGNFNEGEIRIALELIDVFLNDPEQTDYEIFTDEEESLVRGYICFGPRPLTVSTYDLYWIAVNPSVQSAGVGSALVRFMENAIAGKGGKLILIETSGKQSYMKERKFYEKNSYKELVTIKDFYSEGDDLVIYGKYLQEFAAGV